MLIGNDFLTGLFLRDFFFVLGVEYPHAPQYETRVYVAGGNCDAALAAEIYRGATVTGLGGDPTRSDVTCTLVGVGEPAVALPRAYVVGVSDGPTIVTLLRSHADAQGDFVVTALSELDAGVYAFVAESRPSDGGVPEQFETRLLVAGSNDIGSVAEELSDAGMVITASAGGPSGYTLVGTRPLGPARRYSALTLRADGIDPNPLIQNVVAEGLAPVAIMASSALDGGFEVVTVGQK